MFERNEPEISQILEESLEAVLSGSASLEEVLARHPLQARELRGELEAALWLHSRRETLRPQPGFVAASKQRVLAKVRQEARNRGTKRAILSLFAFPSRPAYVAAAALAVMLVLFTGFGSVVSFAQAAVPGEQLYGIKLASEQVAFNLTRNMAKKVEISASYAERRLSEVEALIADEKYPLAQNTIDGFKEEVSRSVELLQAVNPAQPVEVQAAANHLAENMTAQSRRLENLLVEAPVEIQPALVDALGVSHFAAEMAVDVLGENRQKDNPSALEKTELTPTLTGTPATPTATRTKPGARPRRSSTPQPDSTLDEDAQPGKTNDEKQKVSNTPRPTNQNRPSNPGQPSKEDPKPPREEPKPPKDDNPGKSEGQDD